MVETRPAMKRLDAGAIPAASTIGPGSLLWSADWLDDPGMDTGEEHEPGSLMGAK